jgi:CRP-like cAMP-binding protein
VAENAIVAERLAQLALFADLTWPQLEAITHRFEEQVFAPEQRVLRRGLGGSGFYVVIEGSAVVEIDGRERRRLAQGDFFGEISALTGEPPSADVRATSLLRCLVVPGLQVDQFLLDHPRVLLRILQAEARRLRDADRWE